MKRVPELYKALREGAAEQFQEAPRGVKLPGRSQDYENATLQTPALFDFNPQDRPGFLVK